MFKIIVMSRLQAEEYVPKNKDDEVCISINFPQPIFEFQYNLMQKFRDVLFLKIIDNGGDTPEFLIKNKLGGPLGHVGASEDYFGALHARKVIDFLEKNKDAKTVVIHCLAGVSRSRSLAAAIAQQYNTEQTFVVHNPFLFDKFVSEHKRFYVEHNSES